MMRHLPPVHAVVGYTLGLIWGNNTHEQFLEWTDQELMEALPDACEELGVPVPDLGLAAQEFKIQGDAWKKRARVELQQQRENEIQQMIDREEWAQHWIWGRL